jgi:hypothetical protein
VARIATDLAEKLTQSNKKTITAQNRYVAAQRGARKVNAFERTAQELPDDVWITARL